MNDLIARLRGRSQFCKDRGEVKSPDLMNEAADRIEALQKALKDQSSVSDRLAEQLATCEKYRDAYAECDRIGTQAVRDLEDKLALMVFERDEVIMFERDEAWKRAAHAEKMWGEAEVKLAECEARLRKAAEALGFYADANNYEDQHKQESCGCCYYLDDAKIKDDEGAKARATLAAIAVPEALYALSWAKAALAERGVDAPPVDRALAALAEIKGGNDAESNL